MKIEYTKVGDYYLPNLLPSKNMESFRIGRYGRLRLQYLKENKKAEYTLMLINGELEKHLMEIDQQTNERLELLIKQMAEKENVSEELKKADQLKWVGLMNNIKHSAEEIIFEELIYG